MIFSFFKNRRPRQFELPLRYYDARKEAMEERLSRISGENTKIGSGLRIRQHYRNRKNRRASAGRQASLRIVVIPLALLFLVWFIFN